MRVFGLNIPNGVSSVHPVELSKQAKHRLRMMVWFGEHGRNASLTCRHFGISRDTFYRWLRRFEESGPGGLEDGSHRPQNVRKATWTKELENAVLELRPHPEAFERKRQVGRSAGSRSMDVPASLPPPLRVLSQGMVYKKSGSESSSGCDKTPARRKEPLSCWGPQASLTHMPSAH